MTQDPQAPDADVSMLLEPHDTPDEVAAAFRTQRRVAVAYGLLFLVITVTIPLLNRLVGWWTTGRMLGAISPAFAVSTVGLYIVIIGIGVLWARVADQVERRMLGGRELLDQSSYETDEPFTHPADDQ